MGRELRTSGRDSRGGEEARSRTRRRLLSIHTKGSDSVLVGPWRSIRWVLGHTKNTLTGRETNLRLPVLDLQYPALERFVLYSLMVNLRAVGGVAMDCCPLQAHLAYLLEFLVHMSFHGEPALRVGLWDWYPQVKCL